MNKADIARKVGEVLELVQLLGRDDAYPAQLSGEQQQRTCHRQRRAWRARPDTGDGGGLCSRRRGDGLVATRRAAGGALAGARTGRPEDDT
jgi:hypothetical protein